MLKIAGGIVLAVLVLALVLGLVRRSNANACVSRTLKVAGYGPAAISAGLKAYSGGAYPTMADAPSTNEVMWARGVCGLNP